MAEDTENQTPTPKPKRDRTPKGNGHGGARPNSGKKKGALTKRTREVAEKIAAETAVDPKKLTPLEIMHEVMWWAWENKEYKLALEAAGNAAPYIHSRIQAIAHTHQGDGLKLILNTPGLIVGDEDETK